jgi:hypothetical protein
MKKLSEKKLTKREMKAARGPNMAVKVSLKQSEEITIGKTNYMGRDAEYRQVPDSMHLMKVRKGVPYVRVHV